MNSGTMISNANRTITAINSVSRLLNVLGRQVMGVIVVVVLSVIIIK